MLKKTKVTQALSFALMLLLVSSVAITADATDEQKGEITTHIRDASVHSWVNPIAKGIILWDNGMDYTGLISSQRDDVYPFESIAADDFLFDGDQDVFQVFDVHWLGGYWAGPPVDGDFDWEIIFYEDFGDGTKPGAVMGTYTFPNSDVNETEVAPGSGYMTYWVNLPSPLLSFSGGTKYWISIQGIGVYPPQSGWGFHEDPILLHECSFKSEFFGYPEWTDGSTVFGTARDLCFQLTGWRNPKMHFPQLPDLEGWDVNATDPKILADDWQCSQTGWVTDIHFWGSWKDIDGDPYTDDFYTEMPFFILSIHRNLPVGHPDNPFDYSIPGVPVWGWEGEIPGIPSDPPTMEHWFDPNTGEVLYNDHTPYWQYDFVDMPDSFFQYKDSIYWLNIFAITIPPPYQWGWKTSRDHFMDDAVYCDATGPWIEMYEPPRANWFNVYFDAEGVPYDEGSTNYYGQGWYRYEYWWNMWFYDNPFVPNPKHIWLEFNIDPVGPYPYAEFAINWSTDIWSLEGVPGRPPLPDDGSEELYIGRQIFPVDFGPNTIDFWIDDYNPEWVSIDFVATDVVINGWIYHECVQTSMDLAFVITGYEAVPEESLYWKPDYEDYAPSGMPDFDQKQDNWHKDYLWTFCGPVAVANCFWWFDSKYNIPPGAPCDGNDQFPLVRDYMDGLPPFIPPAWDDHDPWNVDHVATPWLFGATPPPPATAQPFVPGPQPQPSGMPPWGELVERLAWYFDTDGVRTGYCEFSGTYVDDMQAGIDAWLRSETFADGSSLFDTLCEVTTAMPTFAYVESLVEKCEDVILLLGFWFEVSPGEWYREGGHYVTVAGINSEEGKIAFSDPYYDNAGAGGRGRVRNGTLIPHVPVPGHATTVHNDAGNVSHDIYDVVDPSPSPGGLWALDGYPPGGWISNFYNQNVPDEFRSVTAPWDGKRQIHTEVEYCVHISPWEYRGDCNDDGIVDIGDAVCIINYLFFGTTPTVPLSELDANCDGVVDIGDVVVVLNYLFAGASIPRCCDP